jgi:hypothetical protein
MWELFLILIVCPVAIGAVMFKFVTKEGASFGKAFAVSAMAAVVFTGLVLWAVNECQLAWHLRGEIRAKLTEAERDTLRPEGLICPTSYSFERQGQRFSAFVLDGWRGAKVHIGTD